MLFCLFLIAFFGEVSVWFLCVFVCVCVFSGFLCQFLFCFCFLSLSLQLLVVVVVVVVVVAVFGFGGRVNLNLRVGFDR